MLGLTTRAIASETGLHWQTTNDGWTSDSPAFEPGTTQGLAAETCVATAMGWRPTEALAPGDLVLTFDRGLRPITQVHRHYNIAANTPRQEWPLHVPPGVVGNKTALTVLPQQAVMLESDTAEMVFGDPFTLLRATDLDGFRGITRVEPHGVNQVIALEFERDEVIFTENGALLLAGGSVIRDGTDPRGNVYGCLDQETAADLLDCIEMSEDYPAPSAARGRDRCYAAFG